MRELEQVLAAIATNEHVATTLRDYEERDRAIELLEDDVAVQRRQLVEELRTLLRPHTRAAMAART
jgi:hypothetical protein